MHIKHSHRKGTNLEDVQEMNRSLIIRLMRKMSVCSRADLAKATGLKQATITNIINDLMDWGLVKEVGIIGGEKGRRSIGIALNGEMYKVIGIRLARKYIYVGLYDITGTEYYVKTEKISILSGSAVALKKMKDMIKEVLKDEEGNKVIGIGVALPGPFIRTEGRIALMTEFPGWENISIREELESEFGLPVYLEHDANAGALAEWWLGSNSIDKGVLVYITAGQGVGAGIIIDGRVLRGSLGIAGEIGHMSIAYDGPKCQCGNRGCLEHYCSTSVLVREAMNELPNYPESVLHKDCSLNSIFEAIKAGDELANKVFLKIARYLGLGIVNVVNAYNPDVIIIGDELSQSGLHLLNIVRKTVEEHVLPSIYKNLRIELSSFSNDPILVGAGALAVDKILSRPSQICSA